MSIIRHSSNDISSSKNSKVPDCLKKLVRCVVRGFYTREHSLIMDMLVQHTIMKEDDLCDRLLFEKKQLRQLLYTLKSDLFIKTRMQLETNAEGKSTRINHYFIDYKLFVNVVKYRLELMRRRLELEERQTISRDSFRCPNCSNTYTDFDVAKLLDPLSGFLYCLYCRTKVEEEENASSKSDARQVMLRFQEQVRDPIDDILRECDKIHLTCDMQEPEIRPLKPTGQASSVSNADLSKEGTLEGSGVWSGEVEGNQSIGATESSVTVEFGPVTTDVPVVKETPTWMVESTVGGIALTGVLTVATPSTSITQTVAPGRVIRSTTSAMTAGEKSQHDEIMQTLKFYERKSAQRPSVAACGKDRSGTRSKRHGRESCSKDNDSSFHDEMPPNKRPTIVETIPYSIEEKEEEDDMYEVTIGVSRVPYSDITQKMVQTMTSIEKEDYIRVGKRVFADIYE